MPLGPPQQYIVTYNGYQLPGYAQSEDDPTDMNLVDHYAFAWDGALTQIAGLTNKNFQMSFKVWEPTYRECKDQFHYATTVLYSNRDGFAPLYVDYTDRYLNATVKSVSYTQDVSMSRKLLTYTVQFDAQPWMIGTVQHSLSGTGTLTTTGRTLSNGGWSPAKLTVSGTNVTVSGYSVLAPFTGFVSISGTVSGFEIDTEATTTTDDKYMRWKDYGLWVGPGEATFVLTGASSASITYYDRWY